MEKSGCLANSTYWVKNLLLVEVGVLIVVGVIGWRSGSTLYEWGPMLQLAGIVVLGLGFLAGSGWQKRGACSGAEVCYVQSVCEEGVHGHYIHGGGFIAGSLKLIGGAALLCGLNIALGSLWCWLVA
jgi:hypothetical protein